MAEANQCFMLRRTGDGKEVCVEARVKGSQEMLTTSGHGDIFPGVCDEWVKGFKGYDFVTAFPVGLYINIFLFAYASYVAFLYTILHSTLISMISFSSIISISGLVPFNPLGLGPSSS